MAAQCGYELAQKEIWRRYRDGVGVKIDPTETLKWSHAAAIQGNGLSALELARVHFQGDGVPQNAVEAYVWLSIGLRKLGAGELEAEELTKFTRFRDELGETLSDVELATANKSIEAFRAKPSRSKDSPPPGPWDQAEIEIEELPRTSD